ncbi:hypothetical protein ELX74_26250 [Escherichia coli]|nr:hypothetical protein ELY35_28955 [Escherichia coli]TFL48638.1 hypothetical protein ELY32_27160 [Escherichia coli]TFL49320.1 hypothetical protein ELY32_26035 [Escherichia coli]TFL49981.1 hypothetical protein ELY35_26525 [Escherichia coli]TFL57854.1 hypothetical protein ELY41_27955 [Escherichia coli]
MGSCAAPSAKRDDKFITTDYLQQCRKNSPQTVYEGLLFCPMRLRAVVLDIVLYQRNKPRVIDALQNCDLCTFWFRDPNIEA